MSTTPLVSKKMRVTASRKTAESDIHVVMEFGPRATHPKQGLQTPLPFLNHMLEHIATRGEFNLDVSLQLADYYLTHVICEDIGITVGEALREYVTAGLDQGVKGYGSALATIDEALARAVISYENRALLDFTASGVNIPAQTENTSSEDLKTFLEGFVQGGRCTLHVDVLKGENGHHIWEAVFRALGEALSQALQTREWRKGITSGVAGPIESHLETHDK